MTIKKIKTLTPYKTLCENLYSSGIFDKNINGLLSIIEKNDKLGTILIERKYINNGGNTIICGYYFIQCFNSVCTEENLKLFREILEKVVKQKARGNYMEVNPIIIAKGFTEEVIDFVDKYNKIQRRKPIELYIGTD